MLKAVHCNAFLKKATRLSIDKLLFFQPFKNKAFTNVVNPCYSIRVERTSIQAGVTIKLGMTTNDARRSAVCGHFCIF